MTTIPRRACRVVRSAFCYRFWQLFRISLFPALAVVAGCQALGPAAKLDQTLAKIEARVETVATAQAELDTRVGTLEMTISTTIGGGGDSVSLWLAISGNALALISYPAQRWFRLRRSSRSSGPQRSSCVNPKTVDPPVIVASGATHQG